MIVIVCTTAQVLLSDILLSIHVSWRKHFPKEYWWKYSCSKDIVASKLYVYLLVLNYKDRLISERHKIWSSYFEYVHSSGGERKSIECVHFEYPYDSERIAAQIERIWQAAVYEQKMPFAIKERMTVAYNEPFLHVNISETHVTDKLQSKETENK